VRQALHALARLRGVQLSYTDTWGRTQRASSSTLIGVLQALGEPISDAAGAAGALSAHRYRAASSRAPKVAVAWDGQLQPVHVRSPPRSAPTASLVLEDGTRTRATVSAMRASPAGAMRATHGVRAAGPLPPGVHCLELEFAGSQASAVTVISSPSVPSPGGERAWGVVAPTYALIDQRMRARGDLSSLGALTQLVGDLGGRYVATLPLLAAPGATDDVNSAPSPYSPISRMWWDDSYLDLARLPELSGERGLADPSQRRSLLELGVCRLLGGRGARASSYRRYAREHPQLGHYATFRAAIEKAGADWHRWPSAWRAGTIGRAEVSPVAVSRHRYAQWATDEQIAEVAATAAGANCGLMLDLPIGCHANGYDPWAYPRSFASGAAVGAPPDTFFHAGQNWGLPPLDPARQREEGYVVLRGALRHCVRYADALRIDHVMGIRRLWWIPDGMAASEGAYVRYRADELLALAILEASRRGARLVGEDLGTVEPALRRMLRSHGVRGTDVALFDIIDAPSKPLLPRASSVALVDTHDTPTFAGWYDGTEIDDRQRLGLLSRSAAAAERRAGRVARSLLVKRLRDEGRLRAGSRPDAVAVVAVLLEELGESRAAIVLATLEDLWGEHDPQNIPGTTREHANFTRPLAKTIEEVAADQVVHVILARLDASRRRAPTLGSSARREAAPDLTTRQALPARSGT
jgi:4-alpha-glucanotransferase